MHWYTARFRCDWNNLFCNIGILDFRLENSCVSNCEKVIQLLKANEKRLKSIFYTSVIAEKKTEYLRLIFTFHSRRYCMWNIKSFITTKINYWILLSRTQYLKLDSKSSNTTAATASRTKWFACSSSIFGFQRAKKVNLMRNFLI